MNQQQRREILIEALLKERGACHEIEIPKSPDFSILGMENIIPTGYIVSASAFSVKYAQYCAIVVGADFFSKRNGRL